MVVKADDDAGHTLLTKWDHYSAADDGRTSRVPQDLTVPQGKVLRIDPLGSGPGKQYGIPWDMGMIGFWYNKALFEKAGITAPPASWDEYLAAVQKLKDAGVTPLAIAGKDQWPSMHLWTYLVLRNGGAEALQQMVQTGDWNTDACIKAGEAVVALNAHDPYQKGYRAATYPQEAAEVGNGKAAMELMGQWAPAVQADSSADKKGLGDDLGWFAFPAVTGGAGGTAV